MSKQECMCPCESGKAFARCHGAVEEEAAVDSDVWQSDAIPYCKVCHKTHGAVRGEKMCGGPGSWIPNQEAT